MSEIKTHQQRFDAVDGRTRIDCMQQEIDDLRAAVADRDAQLAANARLFLEDICKVEADRDAKLAALERRSLTSSVVRITALGLSKVLHSQPLAVEHAARMADRLVVLTAGAAPVPEGWQLVPVEPTPEMVKASNLISYRDEGQEHWKAMLAAAPKE